MISKALNLNEVSIISNKSLSEEENDFLNFSNFLKKQIVNHPEICDIVYNKRSLITYDDNRKNEIKESRNWFE